MADPLSESGGGNEPGFFESFRAVLNDFAALLHTRLELVQTEFEEEAERLKSVALLAAAALFLTGVGVILLTLLIVVIFWDTHRLLALGGLAVFYLAAAAIVGLVIRNKLRSHPKFLSATISEFAKDRERMDA